MLYFLIQREMLITVGGAFAMDEGFNYTMYCVDR